MSADAPPTQHDLSAYEANAIHGAVGKIARLSFAGYGRDGDATFVYQYTLPQELGLLIHDHRDNARGGFAFSVFYPGAGLPQMEWAR